LKRTKKETQSIKMNSNMDEIEDLPAATEQPTKDKTQNHIDHMIMHLQHPASLSSSTLTAV
jgi:hypothetical protein